jgi:hypothetical protein
MEMTVEEALTIFVEAVKRFLQQEELAYADNDETALSTVLFAQMFGQYAGWHVNAEWDKREQDSKWMDAAGKADGDLATKIRPDVVVHIVGKRKNLLVVEMKRSANRSRKNLARDIEKLIGLTQQEGDYGYAVGVHLIVDVTKSVVTGCNAYTNGAMDDHWTAWLRERLP